MRRTARIAVYLLVLVAAATSPCAALADAKAEARRHYDRAVELVDDGQLAGAIVEFQRAYDLTKHFSVLYNIGQVYVSMARPVEAVAAYEGYLVGGGRKIPADRRAEVEKEIARQKARTAILTFRILPDGATVRVDGDEIGKTPLAQPLYVGIGEHVISATAEGHEMAELKVAVASEDRRTVEMTLAVLPGKKPDPEPIPVPVLATAPQQVIVPSPPSTPHTQPATPTGVPVVSQSAPDDAAREVPASAHLVSNLQITGLVSAAIGVAGLAAGTTCWLIARSRHEDAVSYWNQRNNDSLAMSYQSQAKDYMIVANISLLAGGALTALGAVLYILGGQDQPTTKPYGQLRVVPSLASGFAGINAEGTW